MRSRGSQTSQHRRSRFLRCATGRERIVCCTRRERTRTSVDGGSPSHGRLIRSSWS